MGAGVVVEEARAGVGQMSDTEAQLLTLSGDWTLDTISKIEQIFSTIQMDGRMHLVIDGAGVGRFDTAGAWVVEKGRRTAEKAGISVSFQGFDAAATSLLAAVAPLQTVPLPVAEPEPPAVWVLKRIGQETASLIEDGYDGLSIMGEALVSLLGTLTGKRRMRWAALFNNIRGTAIQAVPIIGLMSFLIGMIIAQQGGFYLHTYGADVLVVDLVGVLTCREIGVLLTAIMVAGRSGSAFTAEIGSMKMREEIDALSVLGLSPVDVLILPRLLALAIALPILTLVSDLAAMAGAWVVALYYIGIPTDVFVERLHVSLSVTQVMIGFTKAPFMAAIIGLVACSEGLKVSGSAESLGRHTTASVVKAIFMVVVTDGIFAIAFASLGI